jgi:hypothetical protein
MARGGFQHGGGGGFHQGGGFHGGGHMGGAVRGGGFQGGGFARSGGFHNGGWAHNGGYARGGYNGGYYNGGYYNGGYGYDGFGVGLAAGVIGGALLATQYPYDGYAADYQTYGGSDSQSTVAYCQSRFKSYNVATGTYLGYDGLRHSCP